MADLPPFSFFSSPSRAGASTLSKEMEMALATELILQLNEPDRRENALHQLSKKRELFQELAPLLWSSFGTIAVLIQEILSIYPALSPPTLTPGASNRVCNALALLQCVASHPDTRSLFLNAQLPLYLFPFLTTTAKTKPFEYLRLTSLGVIGSLVKVDDAEVVNYLISTEIVPLCLRTMETGSELSKTVATFIIQKILLDRVGLRYFCSTVEKFYSVGRVLVDMVVSLDEQPSTRLLKHVIRCFLRLSDNPRGCFGLKMLLFELFRSGAFNGCLDDPTIRQWLQQLLQNITVGTAETLLRPRIFYPVLRNSWGSAYSPT
ncbi:CCR4-NOT transcription complex subunit 9 [Cinnamomum micranthum f. kanehirae]|uniref:CCR4-NOT transcription complex subunit 9 n=1 Tax=Cinnamomum micranthum f. kanehirae TaxID=337451 RepID=A0A443PE35_9MAGN|nr:CCR4-NOT transcription complex subunit 9 [Cinnamomum micranthum f. kanehirae]